MPDNHDRLQSPTVFLVRMGVFIALAAFLAFVLQKDIVRAFMANPGLNGVILGVLVVGIVLAIREVARLYREIAWVEGLRSAFPAAVASPAVPALKSPKVSRRPVLLAPMAHLIGAGGMAQPLSTLTWRAMMDSIATRLDEGREILRYITGLLIFLGLLGTFWGLLETVGSIGNVINAMQGNADSAILFEDLKAGIARPLAGMSLSFTASLFGLAGSLVMGFLDLQAGQAQSRFYTDLENLLATRAAPATGPDLTGVSAETQDTLTRMAGAADASGARATTAAMASLAEGIQQLVQHMRTEQQMIRNWADAQASQHAEMRRLIDRVTSETERR